MGGGGSKFLKLFFFILKLFKFNKESINGKRSFVDILKRFDLEIENLSDELDKMERDVDNLECILKEQVVDIIPLIKDSEKIKNMSVYLEMITVCWFFFIKKKTEQS